MWAGVAPHVVVGTLKISLDRLITMPSEKKVLGNYDVINWDKSWLSDNLPRLTEWSRTMNAKMKGEKEFLGVSSSCLGRAMVASF